MLASAAVAMHVATVECSRRAMLPQQQSDVSSKLRRDAVNSARTLIKLTEAIQRRRGKGTGQTVRVERVIVNEGAQAMVGNVTAGTALPASPPAPAAIGQGAAPMAPLDAEPVVAGQGRGSTMPDRTVNPMRRGEPVSVRPQKLLYDAVVAATAPVAGGAKTRSGATCRNMPVSAGARCRMHRGLSAGPRTPEGIERHREAVTRHGGRSQAMRDFSAFMRQLRVDARRLIKVT
ncbi:HGGxSTG domain-containing protein [Lichenibacterium dinghuense]|uniref:HGGxSTG domain-containing protein n=1 Tax=Lichenibacterium dinghuense TaxID=2895977 RepID=UPI001F15E7CA|nr:HGGxSTG domain-containing protein [Lichenibacterium sp. 6Y81]